MCPGLPVNINRKIVKLVSNALAYCVQPLFVTIKRFIAKARTEIGNSRKSGKTESIGIHNKTF